MLPTEPGVRLAIGLPKHGKTYRARLEVFGAARAYPVIVLDQTYEWARPPYNKVPRELAGVAAYAPDVAAAAALADAGKRLIIVHPGDIEAEAEAACRWARYRPGMAGVFVPEAHNAFPVNKPLRKYARLAATAFRHFQVSLWLDTQRAALLSRTFDVATLIRVYSASDPDMKVLREIGGRDLERAVRECARKNAAKEHGGEGLPGHHVALFEGIRNPPYKITRG